MRQTLEALQGWAMPIVLGLGYVVASADRALIAVNGAAIKHDLGLSEVQFAFLGGTSFALLYALVGVPLGLLADQIDRRRLIAAGALVWSTMTAACGLAQSFLGLSLARIGVGCGEACLLPAATSLLRNSLPRDKVGRGVSIFLMGATGGIIVAHLATAAFLFHVGERRTISLPGLGDLEPWRLIFLIAALSGMVFAGVMLSLPEPVRARRRIAAVRLRQAAAHLGGAWRAYVPISFAAACCVLLTQAPFIFLPLHYVQSFGLRPADSALDVGLVIMAAAPVGQWLGGALIDRLGRARVAAPPNMVIAFGAALSAPPALLFSLSGSLQVSQLCLALYCVFASAASIGGLAGWQVLAPVGIQGVLTAILVSCVTLVGYGLGPLMIGVMADDVFVGDEALGRAMCAVVVPVAVLGALSALLGRRAYCAAADMGESADFSDVKPAAPVLSPPG